MPHAMARLSPSDTAITFWVKNQTSPLRQLSRGPQSQRPLGTGEETDALQERDPPTRSHG